MAVTGRLHAPDVLPQAKKKLPPPTGTLSKMVSWAPVWRFCSKAVVAFLWDGALWKNHAAKIGSDRTKFCPPSTHIDGRSYGAAKAPVRRSRHTKRLHLFIPCFITNSLQLKTRYSRTDRRMISLNYRESTHDPSVVHLAVIIPTDIPTSFICLSSIETPNRLSFLLDIVGTVYHLVIYTQSNKMHEVF